MRAATHTETDHAGHRTAPFVLGLPFVTLGAVALGLQLTGSISASSAGSPLTIIVGASGIALFLTTFASLKLDALPLSALSSSGRSLPTVVLGSLAFFFISYAVLILSLVQGWFTLAPTDIHHAVAAFEISWIVTFVFWILASRRLPLLITVLNVTFEAVKALLLISTLSPTTTSNEKIAGYVSFLPSPQSPAADPSTRSAHE
jgi:hypothetical protein